MGNNKCDLGGVFFVTRLKFISYRRTCIQYARAHPPLFTVPLSKKKSRYKIIIERVRAILPHVLVLYIRCTLYTRFYVCMYALLSYAKKRVLFSFDRLMGRIYLYYNIYDKGMVCPYIIYPVVYYIHRGYA